MLLLLYSLLVVRVVYWWSWWWSLSLLLSFYHYRHHHHLHHHHLHHCNLLIIRFAIYITVITQFVLDGLQNLTVRPADASPETLDQVMVWFHKVSNTLVIPPDQHYTNAPTQKLFRERVACPGFLPHFSGKLVSKSFVNATVCMCVCWRVWKQETVKNMDIRRAVIRITTQHK